MKILLVGFKPFATHSTNPSEAVLQMLDLPDVAKVVLDVSYAKAKEGILKAIKEEKPDFILGLGLSPFRDDPTFEQYAYNVMDSTQPDEDGVKMEKKEVVEGGTASLIASFDIAAARQYLSTLGHETSVSIDPGRFVLNEVYYLCLASGIKSLFLHLPEERKVSARESSETVLEIIRYLRES